MAVIESILDSIKKLLGVAADDTNFDDDIIININTVFATLNQMGIGPLDGFTISDNSSKWSDYLLGDKRLEFIKSYMHIKVRLVFDPPQSSAMMEALNREADKLEFRISITPEINATVS